MIKSRLAFIHFMFLVVLLIGCSTTEIVYRDVPIYIHQPEITDTLWLKDTVYYYDDMLPDSVWYSDVVDSLNKKIGSVEVYYKKKIARLKLDAKTDTVFYRDTVTYNSPTNSIIPVVVNSFEWWEKTVFFGGLGMIISFLVYLRIKRGKII